jgi:hypothetical protein
MATLPVLEWTFSLPVSTLHFFLSVFLLPPNTFTQLITFI